MANYSDFRITCPTLTYVKHDKDTDHWQCEYQEWAYAIFASLTAMAGLIPLTIIIYCWAKWKNRRHRSKGTLSRQDSSISNLTDGSRFIGSHDHHIDHHDYEVSKFTAK